MAEEIKQQVNQEKESAPAPEAKAKPAISEPANENRNNFGAETRAGSGDRFGERKRNFKGKRGAPRGRGEAGQEEFEQKMLDIARVTRVMAGGKRMRFRACVAIGNKKGRVAIGLAKGADVTGAVTKAVNKAKKEFIDIPIINDTIPHEIYQKLGAAKILLKPAKKGRGIIAGGVVRIILELSGIKSVTSKILGTGNKVNNAKCVIEALRNLKRPDPKRFKSEKEKTVLTTMTELNLPNKP
jgi:small subunit ribosomal protein S5